MVENAGNLRRNSDGSARRRGLTQKNNVLMDVLESAGMQDYSCGTLFCMGILFLVVFMYFVLALIRASKGQMLVTSSQHPWGELDVVGIPQYYFTTTVEQDNLYSKFYMGNIPEGTYDAKEEVNANLEPILEDNSEFKMCKGSGSYCYKVVFPEDMKYKLGIVGDFGNKIYRFIGMKFYLQNFNQSDDRWFQEKALDVTVSWKQDVVIIDESDKDLEKLVNTWYLRLELGTRLITERYHTQIASERFSIAWGGIDTLFGWDGEKQNFLESTSNVVEMMKDHDCKPGENGITERCYLHSGYIRATPKKSDYFVRPDSPWFNVIEEGGGLHDGILMIVGAFYLIYLLVINTFKHAYTTIISSNTEAPDIELVQ